MKRCTTLLIVVAALASFVTACVCTPTPPETIETEVVVPTTSQPSVPILADPNSFTVELYVDLSEVSSVGAVKAFGLTITHGEHGFPPGLYVTSGPGVGDCCDRLFRVSGPGEIEVIQEGFYSNFQMVFAHDPYGEGILVTEPLKQRILRVPVDGPISVFADGFEGPFGPSAIFYGIDEALYASDQSTGNIYRIDPDGSLDAFMSVPFGDSWGPTSVVIDRNGRYGGGYLVDTFNPSSVVSNVGEVFLVSADGEEFSQLIGGLNGLELLAFDPSGDFGSDLFVPTIGTDGPSDGGVYTLSPAGTLTPFLTGLDATSVAFDTEQVLGGGMFITDLCEQGVGVPGPGAVLESGKIWRVIPR